MVLSLFVPVEFRQNLRKVCKIQGEFPAFLSEVAEFEHLPKPLYLYRVHSGSISSQKRLEQIDAAKQAIGRALQAWKSASGEDLEPI